MFDLSERLREFGWIVPAYTLAPDAAEVRLALLPTAFPKKVHIPLWLDAERRLPMLAAEAHHPRQGVLLRVIPQARAARRDARLGRHTEHLRVDQAHAAHRACAVVHQVPVGDVAVDRRVLAHGRNADAIGQAHLAQLQALEQMAHVLAPRSGNSGAAQGAGQQIALKIAQAAASAPVRASPR